MIWVGEEVVKKEVKVSSDIHGVGQGFMMEQGGPQSSVCGLIIYKKNNIRRMLLFYAFCWLYRSSSFFKSFGISILVSLKSLNSFQISNLILPASASADILINNSSMNNVSFWNIASTSTVVSVSKSAPVSDKL